MKHSQMYELIREKEIIVFGTGEVAANLINETGVSAVLVLDNNPKKWGETFFGIEIGNPSEILPHLTSNQVIVIATSLTYYFEIADQLNRYGLKEYSDYFDSAFFTICNSTDRVSAEQIQYPKIINYPVTNKCNYRCAMCNVWKPEYAAHKDLTPAEILTVFQQPLFQKLEFVGISGGEPFVRKDIVEVIENIVSALPNLKGISIISNASLELMCEKVDQIKGFLGQKNIMFTLQISIDGVDEYHDSNRGVKGAFQRTVRNFYELNRKGFVSEISTTITKRNYAKLWEMYEFARENNVYIRFRLASLIERLYNQDLVENYTFDKYERLIIIKFLENIVYYYEKNPSKKIFYKSLIGQLQGEKRKAGCSWKTSEGLSMDPYGNLAFCFPKSPQITKLDPSQEYDIELLHQNQHLLERTLNHCDNCTHDYVGSIGGEGVQLLYEPIRFERDNYVENSNILEQYKSVQARSAGDPVQVVSKVSILGWYGTETLGDKAIVAGIVMNLLSNGIKEENITLISLHPTLSELTMLELNYSKIRVVNTYLAKHDVDFIQSQDVFIFGGGPLCDVEPLIDMASIFIKAKEYGKRTEIYGSGIGPLNVSRYQDALGLLLNHTDKISLRDQRSYDKFSKIIPELQRFNEIGCFIDPATRYIQELIGQGDNPLPEDEYVLFSFRKWPYMYAEGLTKEQYQQKEQKYEQSMIDLINKTIEKGYKVVLFPMHTYCIGDDDREYYYHILSRIQLRDRVVLIKDDIIPAESINYFKNAKFAVCLRFHSVVFAVTCNTPCIAIDYHYGKGKVSGFMESVGLSSMVYDFDEFTENEADSMLDQVNRADVNWGRVNEYIQTQNEKMYSYMEYKTL